MKFVIEPLLFVHIWIGCITDNTTLSKNLDNQIAYVMALKNTMYLVSIVESTIIA